MTLEHIQITAQAVAEAIAVERKRTAAEVERLKGLLLRLYVLASSCNDIRLDAAIMRETRKLLYWHEGAE